MTSYVMQVCDLCEVCEVCEVWDSQVGAHQVMSLWGSLHGPLRWRWLVGWGMQEKAIPPHMPCVQAHKTDDCSSRSEWNTCPNSTCSEFHLGQRLWSPPQASTSSTGDHTSKHTSPYSAVPLTLVATSTPVPPLTLVVTSTLPPWHHPWQLWWWTPQYHPWQLWRHAPQDHPWQLWRLTP